MKKSDVDVKTFREGFDTYQRLYTMYRMLAKTAYEIETRMSDSGIGCIDDKDDIFTDEEQLRLKKLATAMRRAEKDIHEKLSDYETDLIYKNLRLEEETTEKNVDEDEFY